LIGLNLLPAKGRLICFLEIKTKILKKSVLENVKLKPYAFPVPISMNVETMLEDIENMEFGERKQKIKDFLMVIIHLVSE